MVRIGGHPLGFGTPALLLSKYPKCSDLLHSLVSLSHKLKLFLLVLNITLIYHIKNTAHTYLSVSDSHTSTLAI